MRIAEQWLRDILAVLFRRRPATRAQIIQDTGLNPACVSVALRHLINHGVVERIGELQSTGGRRPELLLLNREAGYFLVVDLEGVSLRFALTDFFGEVCCRWHEAISLGKPLEFKRVLNGIRRLLEGLDAARRHRVLAMGVSYTGLMDEAGRVTAVNLGWTDFPLRDELRSAFHVPVFFGVDGYCKLLAEHWLGAAQGSSNCIYVMLGVGIGTGACINGRFLRGCCGLAGEFGHITIDPSAPDPCACGRTGCLEAIASAPNIVRQYLERAGRDASECWSHPVSEVFARARQRDPAALAAVTRAMRYLGMGLAHLVNILNPDVIVLGGELVEGADVLVPLLEEQLDAHCLPELRRCVALRPSALDHDAGLLGAAALAFRNALQDPVLLHRMTSPSQHRTAPARRRLPRPSLL